MPVNKSFGAAASSPHKTSKRPAPFSIRLSEVERQRLESEAKGAPLGAYIKAKALGDKPLRLRRAGINIQALSPLNNGNGNKNGETCAFLKFN